MSYEQQARDMLAMMIGDSREPYDIHELTALLEERASLRLTALDHFAAAALQGALAGRSIWPTADLQIEWLAELSYRIAQAMLRARRGQ